MSDRVQKPIQNKFGKAVLAAALLCLNPTIAAADSNETARVDGLMPPMIRIGGAPHPNDPPAPSESSANNISGSINGIAYGQSQDAVKNGNEFTATGSWLVHSNSQVNSFACAGTDLFKAAVNPAVPGNLNTTPILLDLTKGVQISATLSNDLSGADGHAPFSGLVIEDTSNANWLFNQSSYVTFHAGTQEPTQWVSCELTWTNTNPEKAQGLYIGFIRLYAMIGEFQ